jgi:DNA primase catalytic core
MAASSNVSQLQSVLEQVKDSLTIQEVLESSGIRTHRMGQDRLRALCPLHPDRDPSLVVYLSQRRWHCFGCGARGDVVDLVQALEGHDSFHAALRSAASRCGIQLPDPIARHLPDTSRLFAEAVGLYEAHLTPAVLDYLRGRGFPEDFIRAKRVGYAPDKARTLLSRHLKRQGHSLRDAEAAGLVVRSSPSAVRDALSTGGGGYIVLPVMKAGSPVDLQGRAFPESPGKPKYCNLPGERRHLYGEDALAGPWVLLCEGILDAMSAELLGLPACAALGVNGFKPRWTARFRRCRRVYVCFDRDAQGRAAEVACMFGTRGRVVQLPPVLGPHGDLNDLVASSPTRETAASTLRRLLEEAPTGYELRIRALDCDDPHELYAQAAPLLAEIHALNPVSRGLLLRMVADRTGLPLDVVREAAQEAAAHNPQAMEPKGGQ